MRHTLTFEPIDIVIDELPIDSPVWVTHGPSSTLAIVYRPGTTGLGDRLPTVAHGVYNMPLHSIHLAGTVNP